MRFELRAVRDVDWPLRSKPNEYGNPTSGNRKRRRRARPKCCGFASVRHGWLSCPVHKVKVKSRGAK